MRSVFVFISTLFLLITSLQISFAEESTKKWPRVISVETGTMTIYQPQIDSFIDNKIVAKSALSFTAKEGKEPLFGVTWFEARVNIDRASRTVLYEDLEITDIRFPKDNETLSLQFKEAVRAGVTTWTLTSSLDAFTTALAAIEHEEQFEENIQTDAPTILYYDTPALLVFIDGAPVLQNIEGVNSYQAVANTPYPLFYNSQQSRWYLNVAQGIWYEAVDITGSWKPLKDVPQELTTLMAANSEESTKKQTEEVRVYPEIVVSQTPTELVVSDGEAVFTPLTDDLLVMSNTESMVFLDIGSQKYFMVISGRWYTATNMTSEWLYTQSNTLPATFSQIPEDSPYAQVLPYVAGTPAAKEAIMDAQIPQTATVQRGEVELQLEYDGKPQWQRISGTNLYFATNSSETVLKEDSSYYLVKDGVWYIAQLPEGPWQVSDHAPQGIGDVPPSSPVYNTKYVYVYDSTPEVVYVGYTPGYIGSYVYGPTIVYGTGYYYPPYISPVVYYPRPATWGFMVHYNSYTGWGFGMSWSSGPFRVGFYSGGGYHHHHGHSYWGPGGYRGGRNDIDIDVGDINIGDVNIGNKIGKIEKRNNLYLNKDQRAKIDNSITSTSLSAKQKSELQSRLDKRHTDNKEFTKIDGTKVTRDDIRNKAGEINRDELRNKINTVDRAGIQSKIDNKKIDYDKINRSELKEKARTVDKSSLQQNANHYNISKKKNNVLADKKGNVYRNENGAWQKRVGNTWEPKEAKVTTQQRNAVHKKVSNSSPEQKAKAKSRVHSGYNQRSSLDRQQYSRERAQQRKQNYQRSHHHRSGTRERGRHHRN